MNIFSRLLMSAVLAIGASLAPVAVPSASAVSVRTSAYAQTSTVLNLRSGPGTGYTVLRVIPSGARVWVASGPYSSLWYRATYGAVTGYVHGAYLTAGSLRRVYRLPTTSKVVALTFDAGSDVGYAASILDTLQAQGVRATFGMTGKWAETNPALMRRIVAEGHGLINHTYDHKSLTGATTHTAPLTYDQRVEELWRTQAAVDQIASATTKPWFRPPYGDEDASVLRDVWSRGYDYDVRWSVDSLGWRGLSRAQIVTRVLDGLEPGAIYLFHVGSQSQDGPALAEIIRQLRSRGYSFATVGAYYR